MLIQSLYNPSGSVRVCLVHEKTRLFTRRGPPSGCVRLTDPAFAQTGIPAGTALGTTRLSLVYEDSGKPWCRVLRRMGIGKKAAGSRLPGGLRN